MKKTLFIIILFFIIYQSRFEFCLGQSTTSDSLVVITQITRLADHLLEDRFDGSMRMAVLPFEATEGMPEVHGLGEAAAMLLSQVLVEKENITVIERQKLKQVLEEIGLSQTGLTQEEIKVGQLLNVDYLIAGAVADLGSRFLVAARMVEVISGSILKSTSMELPASDFLSVSSRLIPVKRYAITATFRSMILPGWGQFYNNKPTKGSILLGSEIVSVSGSIISYILYKQSKDAYERANTRDIALEKYDEMERYSKMNWTFLGFMGVVWLYSVIDSYIDARSEIKKFQARLNVRKTQLSFYYYPVIIKHGFTLSLRIDL
jgi:TolB-like protein